MLTAIKSLSTVTYIDDYKSIVDGYIASAGSYSIFDSRFNDLQHSTVIHLALKVNFVISTVI